ncbi:MAG TPA: hypothetical protein VF017_12920 [Thermoanaerobaculia bacterium]|nr:hypothetical protein [Thermoanaerobaculia bacterium]
MWEDHIVEEMRQAGQDYAAEFGNDVHAMMADLRRREAEHPERVVSLRARTEQAVTEPELQKR